MEIYMLGNGFDLHYSLPTKYANFLNTVKYLMDNQTEAFSSIGQIFGSKTLQTNDEDIKKAFCCYGESYNKVQCDPKLILEFIKNAEENIWFSYLSEMVSIENGWIDVEKEISTALELIEEILSETEQYHDKVVIGSETMFNSARSYVVEMFPFFWKNENQEKPYGLNVVKKVVLDEFLVEVPKGSNFWKVDKKKIAIKLYGELMKLATLLKAYLSWFIDIPLKMTVENHSIPLDAILENLNGTSNIIVTFNYTHTWELLYPASDLVSAEIVHIHGEANNPPNLRLENSDIVLGINRDEKDEPEESDTTFIQFKKYYQRIIFSTDRHYKRIITKLQNSNSEKTTFDLKVIGHSLDVTDKDIIMELFNLASSITIYYYNQNDKKAKVENLVAIYGASELLSMQTMKRLEFVEMSFLNNAKAY